jgi:hypothetical protein
MFSVSSASAAILMFCLERLVNEMIRLDVCDKLNRKIKIDNILNFIEAKIGIFP